MGKKSSKLRRSPDVADLESRRMTGTKPRMSRTPPLPPIEHHYIRDYKVSIENEKLERLYTISGPVVSCSLRTTQGCPKDDDMQQTRLDLTTKGSSVDEKLDDAQKNEEHNSTNETNFFEERFLDSKYRIKKEVRETLKRFSWLSGAYGLTGPNDKIPRPHLYITVKKGKKKSEVLKEIEEAFECDPRKYFELFREPEIKPTFKYTSGRPTSGGKIVAVSKDNDHNPLKVMGQSEYEGSRDLSATGTLTMFCFKDNNHYALTCFHAGCATEDQSFNQTFNLQQLVDIHKSLESYKRHAEEKQEYSYKQPDNGSTDEYGNPTPANCIPLGTFSHCSFDSKSDIMSIKVHRDTEINCKLAEVDSPDWKSISEELYERVDCKIIPGDRVTVQKHGFPSNPQHTGYIVKQDYSYKNNESILFEDAVLVKGDSDTFLKDGDSGALICFFDKSNKMQAFAYGVCEINHFEKEREMTSDEDSDSSSEISNDEELVDAGATGYVGEDKHHFFKRTHAICLMLDTALDNLGLLDRECFNERGNRNSAGD